MDELQNHKNRKSFVAKMRDPDKKPIATKEQTEYVENKLFKLCSIYMTQIETLSEKRFGALIQRSMFFDIERGLGPGQIPHKRYIHSEWFNKWEDELWNRINARLDSVSEDFFKIL